MSTEPKPRSTRKKQHGPPAISAVGKQPKALMNQWELYLTGKKIQPSSFLSKMNSAMAKTGIEIPDNAAKGRFVEALVAKPERVVRLLGLLKVCGPFSDTLRNIVLELTLAFINRLGIVFSPETLDAVGFFNSVASWLDSIRKKPMRVPDLNVLLLLLQFGRHRGMLDHGTAISLISKALSSPVKLRAKTSATQKTAQTSMEALLNTTPTIAELSVLLGYAEASIQEKEKLSSQIRIQNLNITQITSENMKLNTEIGGLNTRINQLQKEKASADERVAELESQIVDLRDGYRHKIDELRGQVRGMLQGQLTRWLQTALDASRSDPPWTSAIQERLGDALRLIEREARCLQPSE